MKLKYYIIIVLISFGSGLLVGYLIHGYPAFESILKFVAAGLSLGFVIEVVGLLREWFKERKEEKTQKREILEKYLQDHSKDLVNDVLKKWLEPRKSVHLLVQNLHVIAQTPLAKAIYNSHSKSEIIEDIELSRLGYVDQAKEHIKEYSDIWNLWFECEKLSKTYLDKNIKICESIEKKVLANIPAKFAEWNIKGTCPPNCYIPAETVDAIYQEANRFMRKGEFYDFFKKVSEQGYFRVGNLYAKSTDESLADEFIKIAYEIAINKNLLKELKSLDKEKKIINYKVEKFKQSLYNIIDDFEKGHENLKGTCYRCKSWHEELASLR